MAAEDRVLDAIIIGAGPAGVSCAIWLARLGFAPLLLEASTQVGGLCRSNPFDDEWNASLPGVAGPQVADNLALSLEQAGVPLRLDYRVGRVVAAAPSALDFTVMRTGGSAPLRARHIVLATGVKARGLPGLNEDDAAESATGDILVGPGARVVAQDFRQKRVAVLGGGDNAFENALYAARHGALKVHLYARSIRAQRQFVRRVPAGNVFLGNYQLDTAARTVNQQPYDVILVFYGWQPCVDFADALALKHTEQGFVATLADTAETSCRGVYAVGEVAQRQHPCVVTALADGVAAAKAIQARIESGPV